MEVRGGKSGYVTIMEFWTLEGYVVGFLKYVAVVVVVARSRLGGDEGAG